MFSGEASPSPWLCINFRKEEKKKNWRAALQNFRSFKNLKAEQEELCGKQCFVQVALCSEGL